MTPPPRILASIALAILCAGIGLAAADKPPDGPPKLSNEQWEKLTATMSGTFDMSKNPWPFCTLLILDQEGNRYPSWWAGGNAGGRPTISTEVDWLEGVPTITQEGSYSVCLVNAPHKPGMERQMPGGIWKTDLKENAFTITIGGIDGMQVVQIKEGNPFGDLDLGASLGKEAKMIITRGTCTGTVSVAGREAPFAGKIEMTFMSSMAMFMTRMEFPLPGKELGLEGDAGKGITGTLWTASIAADVKEDSSDTSLPLPTSRRRR